MQTVIRKLDPPTVIALYRSGESCGAIARRFGVCPQACQDLLVRHGEPRRTLSQARRLRPKGRNIIVDPRQAAMAQAYQDGLTVREVAARFGLRDVSRVYRLLLQAGVAMRGIGWAGHTRTAEQQARDAAIVAAYRAGNSQWAIARQLNLSNGMVWKALVRMGEPRRPRRGGQIPTTSGTS
jgi:transposase